jgi:RsiW-degrading membrane proteinase PrsW (M82 family)
MQILVGAVLSLAASGIATCLYAWLVWWLDHYEKEPWWLLALAFSWGAVPAIILSAAVEIVFDIPISVLGPGLAYELAGSSLVAPVVEEVAKSLAIVAILLFFRREMDDVLDGIVYGAMVGLGFAFTENFFYFTQGLNQDGWATWTGMLVMRAVIFGLNHAFFTGVTGGALGYARQSNSRTARTLVPWLGLAAAITFHSIHNLGATLAQLTWFGLLLSLVSDWGGLLMLALAIGLTWRQEKRWIRTQLASEVGSVLYPEIYELTASYGKRLAVQMGALLRGDVRAWRLSRKVAQTATELAFKKHQLAAFGDEGGNRQIVNLLRAQLLALQQGTAPNMDAVQKIKH